MILLRIPFNASARLEPDQRNSTTTSGPNFIRLVDDVSLHPMNEPHFQGLRYATATATFQQCLFTVWKISLPPGRFVYRYR